MIHAPAKLARRCQLIKIALSIIIVWLGVGSPAARAQEAFDSTRYKDIAISIMRAFGQGDAEVFRSLIPELERTPEIDQQAEAMQRLVPTAEPMRVDVVSQSKVWLKNINTGQHFSVNLALQFEYADSWLLGNFEFEVFHERLFVKSISLTPLKESLATTHALRLPEKSSAHQFVFGLALIIPAFILVALVVCIRTKDLSLKWFWVVVVIIGAGAFHFNWTTGASSLKVFAFQLFGAGYAAESEFAPMTISLSLPLGALAFFCRKLWPRKAEPTVSEAEYR